MRLLTAGAAIAALTICGSALAKDQKDLYPTNITLRAGLVLPVNSDLSDAANLLGLIGVDYSLPQSFFQNGDTFISLDYWFRAFNGNSNGSVVPLMINQRIYTTDTENRTYYFVGVGAVFMDMGTKKTVIGARFGIGQQIGKSVVAELSGNISAEADGIAANAIIGTIGYRF
jgi:hypothetical protein